MRAPYARGRTIGDGGERGEGAPRARAQEAHRWRLRNACAPARLPHCLLCSSIMLKSVQFVQAKSRFFDLFLIRWHGASGWAAEPPPPSLTDRSLAICK